MTTYQDEKYYTEYLNDKLVIQDHLFQYDVCYSCFKIQRRHFFMSGSFKGAFKLYCKVCYTESRKAESKRTSDWKKGAIA
jgi:hypothetical protein